MGYECRYDLTVLGADQGEVETELEDIAGFNPLSDSWTWREHDEHMLRLAKRFPEAVFTLNVDGEETGDVWRVFFKHGEKPVEQKAELVFREHPPLWVAQAQLARDQAEHGAERVEGEQG